LSVTEFCQRFTGPTLFDTGPNERGKDGNPCFLLPITANLKLVANHIFVSKRTMVEGDGQTMHFINFIEIDI
jgi:hypothetical protein